MARQSDAYYDDGTELSPLDSEKHILAQIASNTASGGGSAGGTTAISQTTPGETNGVVVNDDKSSGLPYGADELAITNVAAGPSVIVYKLGGVTQKTRTLSYTNGGASASDVLTGTIDT